MAIISTLRDKGGKFLVFVVGFSIAAFVLGDILGPNSSLIGQNRNIVGSINGEEIDLVRFNAVYEELTYNFSLNNGRSPTQQEVSELRDQAWERLINDISYVEEFNKIGLTVTDKESVDMVQGNNIHPMIIQAFSDPSTGSFNKDNVIGYLQNLSNQPANQQQAWFSFESNLKPMRLRTKYDNLIAQSTYYNSLDAEAEYFNTSSQIDLAYFYIPFFAVSDTLFDVSTNEMRSYLNKNKSDYNQDETRSIDYAFFSVQPSAEDSTFFENEINDIRSNLMSSNIIDDSTYAVINSDSFNPYIKFNPDELPTDLVGKDVGFITEPKYENGSISIKKLSKIDQDAQEKARAKHILLRFDDSNKSTVRTEANRILNLLRSGSDFEETARTYSQDGSASNGGDLGWFTDGMMVKPFQDAVFSRRRSGLIPRIIETDFGFHIINVTYPKTRTSYFVANISKDILPSDNTRNNIYRSAELFKLDIKSTEDVFSDYLKENNIIGGNISDIDKNSTEVGTIPNARNVILWSYSDDRYVGEVSDVLETDEGYIVAQINEMKDEGTKKLDEVENSIKRRIIDEKKYEYLKEILVDYSSLQDLKDNSGLGDIYRSSGISMTENSLSNVGFSPESIGTAFSMQEGELTRPFKIDGGVIVLGLESKVLADTLSNYDDYRNTLIQTNRFNVPLKIDDAIKYFSDIEDDRYKFF
ncbi:MAG: SurA N-terminal domain-containing protein [Bacteroidota bacterium]|nr:SurA N-terminal domain-containing protein [Bacteroidota bacterium]